MSENERPADEFARLREAYQARCRRIEAEVRASRQGCLPLGRLRDLADPAAGRMTEDERGHLASCAYCLSLVERCREAAAAGTRRPWRTWLLVVAPFGVAALFLLAFVDPFLIWRRPPARGAVTELYLSSSHLRESRAQLAAPGFRGGERVYVHATFEGPVWAVMARLGTDESLRLAPGDAVRAEGSYQRFQLEIDGAPGPESVFVLASSTERSRDDFDLLVRALAEAPGPRPAGHAELRDWVARRLGEADGLSVRAETFLHLPR